MGKPIWSDKIFNEVDRLMEYYDDDVFWNSLERVMGQRDFYETITEDEKTYLQKEEWLPDRINKIYDNYNKEFMKNGVKNLRVVNEKK